MGTASWVSKILYAAAKVGLADQLAAGPKSAAALAEGMRLHAPSLHRLMRTLASLGILTEQDEQRFSLTPLGESLQTDAPGSARATLIAFGGEWSSRAWDQILHSMETGNTGVEKAFGMPLFDYLAQHPEEASYFSEAMVGFHGAEPPAVAAAYDFSGFGTVVDVGGATGNMLAAILDRHAGPRGVLFDRPHVVSEAPALLQARGVEERVTIEAGDFFETVPAGGDAYLMSHIIHDWSEEQCLTILGHCRRAIESDGRLLIVEMVLARAMASSKKVERSSAPSAIRSCSVAPIHQLHGEEVGPFGLLDRVDGDDIRVIEGGQRFGFATEALEALAVRSETLGQDLQRDAPLEARVSSDVDLAHPSLAEQRNEVVVAEAATGLKGHGREFPRGDRTSPSPAHCAPAAGRRRERNCSRSYPRSPGSWRSL